MRRMTRMLRAALLLAAAGLAGGCGGQFVFSAGDQVAPAGGEALVVVRLQRNDFIVLAPPVENAPMRFRVDDGPLRAAYTDDLGYAAAVVPVPETPGTYTLKIDHLNVEGEELHRTAMVYVWDPNLPAVAVDVDALPPGETYSGELAATALRDVAAEANVLYLSRREVDQHGELHAQLARKGYPDGPILLWQRKKLHITRKEWELPKIRIEEKMVSRLPEIRKRLPGLTVGICRSPLARKAFSEAGLRCVQIVGPSGEPTEACCSWEELKDQAL